MHRSGLSSIHTSTLSIFLSIFNEMSALRFVTADLLMFLHALVGTPYYVAKIALTSTKSQDRNKQPSALHRYLTSVVRTLIWWETIFLAQNSLFTKIELKRKRDTHVFIEPSTVGPEQGQFDDGIFSVQLTAKDKKEPTRAIWYFNPAFKTPKPTLTNKSRDVPVILYFRE